MPTSLRDLYIEELQDLYSAEGQIIDTLPQMSAAATTPDLKRAFEEHLEQTRVQRERLELIFKALGKRPGDQLCAGMESLLNEGRERLRQDGPGDVKDAALIAAAQRVDNLPFGRVEILQFLDVQVPQRCGHQWLLQGVTEFRPW